MRVIILFALSLSLRPADAGESESSGSSGNENNIAWDHENYHFQQHATISNGECEEEIVLDWKIGNEKKIFKRKCINGLEIFAAHYKAMLMVGSPAADLCIFSTKPDVFYYKDKGQWKQVTAEATSGQVSEADVKATEVELLTDIINRWRTEYDLYLKNKNTVAQEEKVEQPRPQRATANELIRKMDLEKANHKKILDDLEEKRKVLFATYNENYEKEMSNPDRSDAHLNKVTALQRKHSEDGRAIEQKKAAERTRYHLVIQDITNQAQQAQQSDGNQQNSLGISEKFRQVENDFQKKYDSLMKEN